MKTQNFLLISLFALLIGLNVFLSIKYKQVQKTNSYLTLINTRYEGYKPWLTDILKENILIQQLSEASDCREMELKGSGTKKNIPLEKIIKDEPKLFFRFKETHCDGCVQSSVRMLSQLSDSVPELEITVLSGYQNVRQFNAYSQSQQKFEVYNVNEIPLPTEYQDQPYLFVVTPDYRIRNVFITVKDDDLLTEQYLKMMQNKYWHSHIHGPECDHSDCDHLHH
jgi:hypothetical protein